MKHIETTTDDASIDALSHWLEAYGSKSTWGIADLLDWADSTGAA
jgi:alcohol dehydrogenase class IV